MARDRHEAGLQGTSARRPAGDASTALWATFMRSFVPAQAARLRNEAVSDAFDTLVVRQARRRARRDLAGLSDQMLHDIGVTRTDVERAYRNPFWWA